MFIDVLSVIQGDDYIVRKVVQKYLRGERVLFQRRKTNHVTGTVFGEPSMGRILT